MSAVVLAQSGPHGLLGRTEDMDGTSVPCPTLFNLGNVQLEKVVEPVQQLLSGKGISLERREDRRASDLDSPMTVYW